MILEGQAARDYINKNPNSNYRVLSGAVNNEQRVLGDGILGSLARSILLDPIARIGEGLSSAAFGSLQNITGDRNTRYDPMWRNILGSDLSEEVISDPLKQGVAKGGAGLASLLVGGGGIPSSLGKAVGVGALTGGLGSFGASRKGEGLQAALTGAAIGAPLGALGYGLSKIGSKGTQAAIDDMGTAPSGIKMRYGLGEEVPNFQSTIVDDISNTVGEFNPSLGVSDDITTGLAGISNNPTAENVLGLADEFAAKSTGDDAYSAASRILKNGLGVSDDVAATTGRVGGLGKKIEEVGKGMERRSIGIQNPKTPQGIAQGEALLDDVNRITGGKNDARGMGDAFSDLSGKVNTMIKNSNYSTNLDDIINSATDDLVLTQGLDRNTANALVKRIVSGSDNILDMQGIANLKKATQSAALKAQRITDELGGNLTRETAAKQTVNRIADDILKTNLEGAAPLYQDMAILHKVAPDIIKAADKSGHITVAATKVPDLGILSGAQRLGGKALQGIGRTVQGIQGTGGLGNIGSSIGNALSGISPTAALAASYSPVVAGVASQYESPQGVSDAGAQEQGLGMDTYSQSPLAGMTKMDLLNWALAQTGGDLSTALTIAKYLEDDLVGGAGEATPQSAALSAIQQLRELYGRGSSSNVGTGSDLSLGTGSGAIGKAIGSLRGAFKNVTDRGFTNDLQIFTNQAQQILGLITQALGSGAPQEAEAKRLMDSIPNASTSNEAATAWFNNMEKLINSVSGGTQFSTTDDSSQF